MDEPNAAPFPKMETQRLRLRRLHMVDAEGILDLRSDPEAMRYLNGSKMEFIDQAHAYIDKINDGIDAGQWIFWSLVLKTSPQFIGTICLWNINREAGVGEIGYELIPRFQQNGFMREAMTPVLAYAFESMRLSAVEAVTHKENEPSRKLLLHSGFVLVPPQERRKEYMEGWDVFRLEGDKKD